MDDDAEALSFPKIFCGVKRKFYKPITYCKIAKSDFRRFDRRCASNVAKLLYSYKKLQILQVSSAVSIALRQKQAQISVKNVRNEESIVR